MKTVQILFTLATLLVATTMSSAQPAAPLEEFSVDFPGLIIRSINTSGSPVIFHFPPRRFSARGAENCKLMRKLAADENRRREEAADHFLVNVGNSLTPITNAHYGIPDGGYYGWVSSATTVKVVPVTVRSDHVQKYVTSGAYANGSGYWWYVIEGTRTIPHR